MTTAHILPTGAVRGPENRPHNPVCPSFQPRPTRLAPLEKCVTLRVVAGGGLLSAILSEQPDDVLADLRRQLEQRIADARAVLAQSESELRFIEQAIAARGGFPDADGPSSKRASGADGPRDREPDGRFQGLPRATILAVASTVPYPITPARVVEAFARRGETVNIEQIRIALNRITKDGNLTKVGPSRFALPHAQPGEPNTPQARPESETGMPRATLRRGVLGTGISQNTFRPTS